VRFEDQSLKLLESRLSDGELRASVPHSIGLLPEESVIITDFFPATSSFHRDVLRATMPHFKRRDVTVLERQAAAIGAWLAAFQSAVSENAKELLALELEEARHRLAELPLLSPSEKKRTMEIVASLSSELGPMPVLLSHGDFAPRNILFRGEKVIVIDWEMVPDRPRPFLFDAHYFAACLSKRHTDLLVTRYIIDRCMTAFLEGYSKACPYPEFLQPAWRATRLVALVTVMSRQFRASRRSPVSSWLTRKRPFLVHLATEIRKEL
jgi:Ser/Thr protein kinase RdoA (MazF antagonist)